MNQRITPLSLPFSDSPVLPPDRLFLKAASPVSANFQFRFAITFRLCYFTPRADSAIMFHHIDCKFISKEKVSPVFY